MKKSKVLILLFTLSFPVILYLFLRSYGENKFALPIFFEKEEKILCADSTMTANQVKIVGVNKPDTVILSEVYMADYKVVHMPDANAKEIQKLKNELNRVLNTFDDLSIQLLTLLPHKDTLSSSYTSEPFLVKDKAFTYHFDANDKEELVNCIYAVPTAAWKGEHPAEETIAIENTLILLDNEDNIRGYYDGYETKDVDRLILEIRVLLSNRK